MKKIVSSNDVGGCTFSLPHWPRVPSKLKVNQSLLGTEAQAQMNAVTVADTFLFLTKSYL